MVLIIYFFFCRIIVRQTPKTREVSVKSRDPLPAYILDVIREKNRVRCRWQRYRFPQDRELYKDLHKWIKKSVYQYRCYMLEQEPIKSLYAKRRAW